MNKKVKYIEDNYCSVLENNFNNQYHVVSLAEFYEPITKLIEDGFIILDNRRNITLAISRFQKKWPKFINKLYVFIKSELKKLSVPVTVR